MGNSCMQTQNESKVKNNFLGQNDGGHIQIDQKVREVNYNNLEFDRFLSKTVLDNIGPGTNFCLTVLDEDDGKTIPQINDSRNPKFIQSQIQNECICQMDQIQQFSQCRSAEKPNTSQNNIEKALRIEKTLIESNEQIRVISNRIIQTKIKLQKKVQHQSRSTSARIIPILKKLPRNRSLSSTASSYKKVRFQQQGFLSVKYGRI